MIQNNPFPIPTPFETPRIEHVLYWVWEREAIRIAKENSYEGELTKDPILKQYRFCNIRRRDDRVSRWILENMLNYPDNQDDDLWFVAAIARYVNWPPMLAKLLEEGLIPGKVENFDHVRFGQCIDEVTRSGGKAWSGAYMTFPCKKIPGQPKGAATAEHILAPLADSADKIRAAIASGVAENVYNTMLGGYGWQSFMCGQVAADCSYVYDFEDVNTWAPMGPGSQRGLSRLNGRSLNSAWDPVDFNAHLRDINNTIRVELDIDGLTLHDVQNCMCEIDKYWRVLYNEGRPRATYKPETAF